MLLRRVFLWAMLISVGLSGALAVFGLLLGDGPNDEILITTLVTAGCSLLAMGCALVLERRRTRVLMWIGLGTTAGVFATAMMLTWLDFASSTLWVVRLLCAFLAGAVASPHSGLLLLPRLRSPIARAIRVATLVIAWSIAGLVIAVSIVPPLERFLDDLFRDDLLARLIGSAVVLLLCGTVTVPLVAWLQRLPEGPVESALPGRLRVALGCPRCGEEQKVRLGAGACRACGLRIEVNVDEPRCACGYLLYHLAGEHCPECGRPVASEQRWMAESAGDGPSTPSEETGPDEHHESGTA